MRLWSIHPEYLDTKGLLALWREGLLAKKVLEDKTKGYRNHPQLIRFKNSQDPICAINTYLYYVYLEAERRNYNFDTNKILPCSLEEIIPVTEGQIEYEFQLLLSKLKIRDKVLYESLKNLKEIKVNPVFRRVQGRIEKWEKVKIYILE